MNNNLDQVLAALAEPSRRRILESLSEKDQSIEELAEVVHGTTWNTLKHVRVLEESGLILSRKVGRKRICYLQQEGLQVVTAWTINLKNFWSQNLSRLEEHMKSDA